MRRDGGRWRPAVFEFVVLGALTALAPTPASTATASGTDGPESRAQSLQTAPQSETSLGEKLPLVDGLDAQAVVLGDGSGTLVQLSLERYRLWSRRSIDGGVNWSMEAQVEGPELASGLEVLDVVASLGGDGKIYAAYRIADPLGDAGLRFRRSDDFGLTWTAPVDLVRRGDANHGIEAVQAIAANASGRVAVVYRERWERLDAYARVSSNAGATWNPARNLDIGDTAGSFGSFNADVAVAAGGNVHAVFVQNRGTGLRAFSVRSTDGGATFTSEVDLGALAPSRGVEDLPQLALAADGSVLVAATDTVGSGTLQVWRSVDGGASFANTLSSGSLGTPSGARPYIVPSSANGTVFAGYVASNGDLRSVRSTDHGATWAAPVLRTTLVNQFRILRTSAGTWVVAAERRPSTGNPLFIRVEAQSSTNDGASFSALAQADQPGTNDSAESRLQTLAATGADAIGVAFLDPRPTVGDGSNLWLSRSAAATLNFAGGEARVDDDHGLVPSGHYQRPVIAALSGGIVLIAFRAIVDGNLPDVYFTKSTDGGATFSTPIRLSQHAAGTEDILDLKLAVGADGLLDAVWARRDYATGTTRIVIRGSGNYGTTWDPESLLVSSVPFFTSLQVVRSLANVVNVIYGSGSSLFRIFRDEFGFWNGPFDFDQAAASATTNDLPSVCYNDTALVVVAWRGTNDAATANTIWARVSTDEGRNFGNRLRLRADLASNANAPDTSCNTFGNDAIVAWADGRDATKTQTYASRFATGVGWTSERQVAPFQSAQQFLPRTAMNGNQGFIVYSDNSTVWFHRSDDGGLTWQSAVRLDDSAAQPIAGSRLPYVAAARFSTADPDKEGHVYAVWQEASAGANSIVMRRSYDWGRTWDPAVIRLDTATPQGTRFNALQSGNDDPIAAAVSPSRLQVVWAGQRSGFQFDTLTNRLEFDLDQDGYPAGVDCDENNPTIKGAPVEVSGVAVSRVVAAARVAWSTQDGTAGSATNYDVVTGFVADLRASGGYGAATCLANNLPDTPYDDTRGAPAAGQSYYYQVRAQHACTGTYGNAVGVAPDPRDLLDSGGPCP